MKRIDIISKSCGFPVDESTTIDQLGMDSLELCNLFVEIGLPVEKIADFDTVGELLKA
jgi:acyl carrier protein